MNHNQTHLLVVEDSPTQAEYIRRILQREGFIVSVASDGRAALEALENDTFDLVISDIIMPGMGGYELCQQIKEKSSIPVVLVTQLFDPEDIIRGLASGADGFIIKPFDPVSLLDTITNMLESEEDGRIVLDGDLIIATPGDQTYTISSDRKTILRILLSTYATAVNKNMELQEARDELYGMNEQLQEYVEELRQTNDELHQEMIERQRMEKEVSDAHRKLQLMTTITRDDIRNQLTIIEGYLELAESREEEVSIEEAMERIRLASRRIGRIIEFTRDFQKIGMEEEEWLDLS
ncbi:MAG: Response regulator receiver sensor signal transduction histidine kinase, partial [Methanomicrobiales archaeon 53_19]